MHVWWNRVYSGRSRSSKIVDFGTNRKHAGLVLRRFRDIADICDFLSNYAQTNRRTVRSINVTLFLRRTK